MNNRHPADFQSVPFRSLDLLPTFAGIYFAMQDDEILYVGQSKNIRKRWESHHKRNELLEFENVRIHWIGSDGRPLLEQESEWIRLCNPPLNYRKVIYIEKVIVEKDIKTETPSFLGWFFVVAMFIANIAITLEYFNISVIPGFFTFGGILFLLSAACYFSSMLTIVLIRKLNGL